MAKKTEVKELKLEDFFTNTINANGSKMFLVLNGEPTKHYFLVKGIGCKSVSREKINARAAVAAIEDKLKGMEEGDLKESELFRLKDDAYKPLVLALVSDWSFNDDIKGNLQRLLDENEGLTFAVISHASDEENLKAKK